MSIGDVLTAARRQAGLTITQVSQRTRIRETIIRGIERDDFSACGGDFYARGHIRAIARAVGADPDPLIGEYDSSYGTPQASAAAGVPGPLPPSGSASGAGRTGELRCWWCSRRSSAWSPITWWHLSQLAAERPPAAGRPPRIRLVAGTRPRRTPLRRLPRTMAHLTW